MSGERVSSEDGEIHGPTPSNVGSPVGFVAAVIACAVFTGLLVITATVLAVDTLRPTGSAGNIDRQFYILVGGTLTGLLVAGFAAWTLLGPVSSTYRRGGLSIVSAFATVLFMLVCIPINELLGRTGLLSLIGLSGLAALLLGRRARRWGSAG
jgi:hypothetical protein